MKISYQFALFLLLSAAMGGAQDMSTQPQSSGTSPQSSTTDQTPTDQVQPMDQTPTFHVNVVGRTTKAINYHFRSGSTKVDLKGTDLAPQAHGAAKVESQKGRLSVDASVNSLDKPQEKFGNEYLTYVLWAITPEGRASNLGEFVPGENKKISVTTDLQAFGLIVTAEPYFGVTQPSDLVVLENSERPDTVGASEYIDAHYELVGRHQYIPPHAAYSPTVLDPKIPLYLHEARNAVRIAEIEGAPRYAAESFDKAAKLLQQAEDYQARKKPESKPIATVAREAVQMAEDARVITIRRRGDEIAAKEKQAAAERESQAKAQTEQESQRRVQAETTATEATQQRAQAEAERAAAMQKQQEAQAAADAANKAKAEADAAREAALQQQQAAQAETQQARAAAQSADQQRLQAIQDKEALRAKLLQQLNTILETKDTARGLIVNISDVLFDTGQYTLKPGAREKLAKVSGIVLAYPDLKLQIEGYTDNVGSDAFNQRLSEKRAEAVKQYLTKQGVPESSLTAQGLGKSDPVASNATPSGRQQNRRVEMVVSGEAIGTKIDQRQNLPASDQPAQVPNHSPK